eukprot:755416-Hanusia_phi.AAC.2
MKYLGRAGNGSYIKEENVVACSARPPACPRVLARLLPHSIAMWGEPPSLLSLLPSCSAGFACGDQAERAVEDVQPTYEHDGISVWDITPQIKELIKECGMREGFVNVISRHTTTAVMINEYESRLIKDLQSYFLKIAPPDDKYLHNEIHLRPETEEDKRRVLQNNWDINDPNVLEAWRSQEPFNAHSHLLSMMLGNSESIPVSDGKLAIGQWQSVMLVDLDGPRTRTVGIQVFGM